MIAGRGCGNSMAVLGALVVAVACCASTKHASTAAAPATFTATVTKLVIPQVDYEPAIYYSPGDPYPHIDFNKVDPKKVVSKEHQAVILDNEYVRVTVLPAMGRVYAIFYKPTGHDELWRNDIATTRPQGGNPLGFWLWIGGVEHTLPVAEHGSTFALPWSWELAEDSPARKTVRMKIREPGTKLEETLEFSLYPGRAYYETSVAITNPTAEVVQYVHWINPQWTPGGHNELTDNTEFIIPTDRILIAKDWQKNMGESPQDWVGNKFRFIKGWARHGDLMADGIRHGFYSAYSHDEQEGMVRVFDKDKTPGVDIWTYGYHPREVPIPMGSGATNKGYAEMWGGTSKLYGDDLTPLAPGATIAWTEWMYPYQKTGGLTFADRELAVHFVADESGRTANVGLCPSGPWQGDVELVVEAPTPSPENPGTERSLKRWSLALDPTRPFSDKVDLGALDGAATARLRLKLRPVGGPERAISPAR